MAADPTDTRTLRKNLKHEIRSAKLILSLPGLTEEEIQRQWQLITNANLIRYELRKRVTL